MSVWIHFLHRSIFEIHWYLSLSNLISRSPFLLVNLFILEILTSFNHTVRVSDQFRPSKSDFWQAAPQSLGIETPSLKLQVSPPETADVSPFPGACIPGKMDEKLLLPQKKITCKVPKIDTWKMNFLLGPGLCSGAKNVRFKEGNCLDYPPLMVGLYLGFLNEPTLGGVARGKLSTLGPFHHGKIFWWTVQWIKPPNLELNHSRSLLFQWRQGDKTGKTLWWGLVFSQDVGILFNRKCSYTLDLHWHPPRNSFKEQFQIKVVLVI